MSNLFLNLVQDVSEIIINREPPRLVIRRPPQTPPQDNIGKKLSKVFNLSPTKLSLPFKKVSPTKKNDN
ncbi:hypothetical protein Ae201684_000251 [Aphanomyces euteiches]|uniref:Uncharacterized protein n=1 Tax=Aphanomyces euteiches TaxID=100861 RepID=A0A6G0XXJ1_9STRA|nr:hypothetical protein Ae201684_000251 [Aphanomyces euteiches]